VGLEAKHPEVGVYIGYCTYISFIQRVNKIIERKGEALVRKKYTTNATTLKDSKIQNN
jgi:hypothetical protein